MYSIGQLALILKVSTRTLRHYDDIGLIKPYHVNEENGYRYYGKEQISLAKNIIKLKEYGLSLEEIKEVITDDRSYKIVIKKRLNIIETEVAKLIAMKENLYELLKTDREVIERNQYDKKYNVQIVELDEINVIKKRCTINMKNVGEVVGLLYETINKHGLKIKGGHIIKYFENEYDPENADIEVCIPVESRKECKIKFRTIDKGKYVTATANSISEKGEVYESIINWVQANSYTIIDNPFEQYSVGNGLFKVDLYWAISV